MAASRNRFSRSFCVVRPNMPGLAIFLMLGISSSAGAQPAKTAADGIFTAAQATRGGTFYQDSCAACHGGALQGEEENPPLSGNRFSARWGNLPASALFNFINTQMPLGQPGMLGMQGAVDVTAYILSINKFPAGDTELPTDAKVLSTITINKQ